MIREDLLALFRRYVKIIRKSCSTDIKHFVRFLCKFLNFAHDYNLLPCAHENEPFLLSYIILVLHLTVLFKKNRFN